MSDILFQVVDGHALITLNRPDKLNSFTAAMHRELRTVLADVQQNRAVRAVIVTGAGRGFCGGQDLGDGDIVPGVDAPDLGKAITEHYNPLVRVLRGMPLPVIAAVNGVAAGAGANIALACDFVIAARSASFVQSFCKVGLMPDSGGTWWLPRLVGDARARSLAMLGDKLTAEDAAAWGMIWRCVEDAELMQEAGKLARRFSRAPAEAVAAIKKALQASSENSLETQLEVERAGQRQLGFSEDYREAIDAFMNKRVPNFRGR